MDPYMYFSPDYVFTSQPPYNGETAVFAPLPPPSPQHSLPDYTFSNNMYHHQHIPPQQQPHHHQHQQLQHQQQRQQTILSQAPQGCNNPVSSFNMPMNYMGQGFANFGASPYIAANFNVYNAGSYPQQHSTIPSDMLSGYVDHSGFRIAPENPQPIPHGFDTSAYDRSAYNPAAPQQQQPAMMPQIYPEQFHEHAPFTPPGQQQLHKMTPRMSSGYTMAPMGRQLPTPPTASPAPRQGLKRAADDGSSVSPAKRQATVGHNAVRQSSANQLAALAAQAQRVAAMRAAQAEQLRQAQLAQAEVRAKAEAAEAKRQEDLERQQAEDAAEQARLRADHEQAKQAKAEAAAQKARDDQVAEELRIAEEERSRRIARGKELRKDPNANFHSYLEILEYFPLQEGQEKNQYMANLLANRPLLRSKPGDDWYDAIMFSKEHWYDFASLRDYEMVLERVKKRREQEAAAQATRSLG